MTWLKDNALTILVFVVLAAAAFYVYKTIETKNAADNAANGGGALPGTANGGINPGDMYTDPDPQGGDWI